MVVEVTEMETTPEGAQEASRGITQMVRQGHLHPRLLEREVAGAAEILGEITLGVGDGDVEHH